LHFIGHYVVAGPASSIIQAWPKCQLIAENELTPTDVDKGPAAVDGWLQLRAAS